MTHNPSICDRARELAKLLDDKCVHIQYGTGAAYLDLDEALLFIESALHAIAAETVEECAKCVEAKKLLSLHEDIPAPDPIWQDILADEIRQLAKGDGHG